MVKRLTQEDVQAQEDMKFLRQWMPAGQWHTFNSFLKGEEKEFFQKKARELVKVISEMPKTMETDGQGDKAILYLHYFNGPFDWYIQEKDEYADQNQAFGLVHMHEAELGYISIPELTRNAVELDLHWEPKTRAQLEAKNS